MSVRCLSLMVTAFAVSSSVARADDRLSDEARGEQLYTRHCLACHGAQLDGHGPVAAALIANVPDLRLEMVDANIEGHVAVVLAGQGSMPSFSLSFDRYDARRVWRHMQRVATSDIPDTDTDADAEPDTQEAAP
ncbi:MAG: mono/diheme cytochrome c family protein [Myxococcota bacterium]|jgi:mono/diheme cytochrome c family protein